MLLDGWIKYFADGTFEEGYDYLVEQGKASWRNGHLDNITRVVLQQGKSKIILEGEGEFWQSDTYEARFKVNEGCLVQRTLYKKIMPQDRFIFFTKNITDVLVVQVCSYMGPYLAHNVKVISQADIGRWIRIDMDHNGFSIGICDDGQIFK